MDIGDDALLLSTEAVTGFMNIWDTEDKEFVMVDKSSGAVRWRVPHEKYPIHFATAPSSVVMIGAGDSSAARLFAALSRRDGHVAWTMQAQATARQAAFEADGVFVVATPGSSGFALRAFELETGRPRWQTEVPARGMEQLPGKFAIQHHQGLALLLADNLTAVDPASGKLLWSVPLTLPLEQVQILASGRNLFLHDADRLQSIDPANGRTRWQIVRSGDEWVGPLYGANALLLMSKSGANRHLSRIDLASGKTVWQAALGNDLRSHFLLQDQRIYYTTTTAVRGIDLASGKPVANHTLPLFMHIEWGQLDRLAIHGGAVVVARENGVIAFAEGDGRLRYAHHVAGYDAYSARYLSKKLLLRRTAYSSGYDRMKSYTNVTGALRDQMVEQSTGKPAELTGHVGYGAGFEAAAQAAHMAASVAAAGVAFRQAFVTTSFTLNQAQIAGALVSGSQSLQHDYFLRPFYRDGWGVTVVRLRDGARADLYVSPPNEPLLLNHSNNPLFLIDAKRGQLLALGLGMGPYGDEVFQKVGWPREPARSFPGVPPTWTIPYASLFSYELSQLKFVRPDTPSLPRPPQRLAERDLQLQQAVFAGDIERTNQLIAQGANVNAADQDGFNTLFFAAMTDQKDMVALLISHGVDATRRDHHDWLAYHYNLLTHADNRSTVLIRDAYVAQSAQKE